MIELPPIPPIVIKLLGGLLVALALFMLVHDRNAWKHKASDRQATINLICKATGAAASNPKLECGHVVDQINQLGNALKVVTDALNDQNVAVAKLKLERDAAQVAAAKVAATNRPRLDRIAGTIMRLDASSRDPARQTQSCAPSAELKGAWQ